MIILYHHFSLALKKYYKHTKTGTGKLCLVYAKLFRNHVVFSSEKLKI